MEVKSTKSDVIRSLAREGLPVADIARKVGVRYQHARNVLANSGLLTTNPRQPVPSLAKKPSLKVEILQKAGFIHLGCWLIYSDQLVLEQPAPRKAGVYAFVKDGIALYVGVATMGLAKRLYFYGRPGKTQATSLRLNALLKEEIGTDALIQVYVATPDNMEWNGLPVNGAAGLELGLIHHFDLPWNKRSAGLRNDTFDKIVK